MALHKHDIPILEYDDAQDAVIMPQQKHLQLPPLAVFPFLGTEVDRFAEQHNCEVICELQSMTKPFPIYRHTHHGRQLCLCQAPVGASAAVQLLDFMIGCGVRSIISAGSCGALRPLDENVFLIPTEALRDEGASYHYLPPSRTVAPSAAAVAAIEQTLTAHGIRFERCMTWSTDGFYRETHDMVRHRMAEGCAVVEMECAALFACAKFRGAHFAQLLYTADTLADTAAYDARDWGTASVPLALRICLDAVTRMP